MVKHGRGSGGSGLRAVGLAAAAAAAATGERARSSSKTSLGQPKRRRGAPQTFSSKLFRILQAAEHTKNSPVGWCVDGKSFTVHNDKDFETQVLAANYRHAKFSSFQRQLNMYGFRKVADCSDRTYSHPFFRRDQPDLLNQVRRVVNDPLGSVNANISSAKNKHNLTAPRTAAAVAPPPSVAVMVAAPQGQQSSREDGVVGFGEARAAAAGVQHARKKVRRCAGGILPPSSVLGSPAPGLLRKPASCVPMNTSMVDSSGDGGVRGKSRSSSPRGHLGGRGIFPYPSHQPPQGHAGVTGSTITAQQRMYRSQQQQQQQDQRQQQQQQQGHFLSCGSASGTTAVAACKPTSPRHDFTPVWHQHTGHWTGATLSGGGSGSLTEDGSAWTTSSSVNSSVDDATSPVLLPITPADLDCGSGGVPPFRLQPDVSMRLGDVQRRRSSPGIASNNALPALVSPAPVSASSAARFGAASGTGVLSSWRGGTPASMDASPSPGAAAVSSFVRPPSSGQQHPDSANALAQNVSGLHVGGGGKARTAANDEGISFSLERVMSYAAALPGGSPLDLGFDHLDPSPHSNQSGAAAAQIDKPVPNSNKLARQNSGSDGNNAVVPASPATPADPPGGETASAGGGGGSGWDLACLGGPGWGSPETSESPAAGAWAAIPPLSTLDADRGSSPRPSWAAFGDGGAAIVERTASGDGASGNAAVFDDGGCEVGGGAGTGVGGDSAHSQYQQHQQHQQPRLYNRNLSITPVFSVPGQKAPAVTGCGGDLPGGVGVDSLDWVLLGGDGVDTSAAVSTGGGGGGGGRGGGGSVALGLIDETPAHMGTRV